MNNTINTSYNNISFNGRYLVIPENYEKRIMFPRNIKEAIKKNEYIREFISAGNPTSPRTFWEKLKDLFKKDEVLEVYYNYSISALNDIVHFRFGKKGSKKVRTYDLCVNEENIKNIPGFSESKSRKYYDDKHSLIMDMFTKEVEKIKDFESLLSSNTTTMTKPL